MRISFWTFIGLSLGIYALWVLYECWAFRRYMEDDEA